MKYWSRSAVEFPGWRLLVSSAAVTFMAVVCGLRGSAVLGTAFGGVAIGLAWHAQAARSLILVALFPWALALFAGFVFALPVPAAVHSGRSVFIAPHAIGGGAVLLLAWLIALAAVVAAIVSVRRQGWSKGVLAAFVVAGVFVTIPIAALASASNPSVERTHNGGARLLAPSPSVAPSCAAHVKR